MARGTFIVIEGGDGAGKSRLQAALADRLRPSRPALCLTREPGGTPLGERIRDLVLDRRSVGDPLAELLLFEAARAHLVRSVIAPALERGETVLCDRFTASSIAYQGVARGLGRELVERASAIATGGLDPDLTLLLDVPVEVGLRRRAGDGGDNHFDRETAAFHELVRRAFLDLAAERPAAWLVIDATLPFDTVLDRALAAIESIA